MRKTILTDLSNLFDSRYVTENELNYKTIRDMLFALEEEQYNHATKNGLAHTAEQVLFKLQTGPKTSVQKELTYQSQRVKNLVLGNLGNGQQEVRDSRTSLNGFRHPLLSERLRHDFLNIDNKIENELNVADSNDYLWTPPFIPSTESGVNETPSNNNPTENLKVFYDKFVDDDYCTKSYIGKDQSGQYNVYSYKFEPKHYTKTVVVTSCIHGNEYSAFYAMARFMDLIVNKWQEHSQLAYLRKNVRLILVPIVNPWGFANNERENVNNVDLNRNFDYMWSSGTSSAGGGSKGTAAFSEAESKNMRKFFQGLSNVTGHVDCHNITSQVSDYCLFYPRFSNQQNNIMTEMMHEMQDYGDYVTWGSSTLSSFSNWVGINQEISSFLPEIYEGRAGKPRSSGEMWRSVYFIGNIVMKLASATTSKHGRTALEPIAKSFVYSSRFNSKGIKPFSLIAKTGYQRMLMTQQRFKVTGNGFVELNGSITIDVDRDTTIGINPGVVQNYNPFFGNGKTRRRQLYKIEHKVTKGTHTIPINAIAGVQYSTTAPPTVKRTNEVMAVVDVMRTEGVAHVTNMILNIKFTPSHSHNAVQIFNSTSLGNQKEETFTQIYPNKPAPYDIRNDIKIKK